MVLELDIERCAREEAKPRMGVDTRWRASKDAEPRRGGLGGPTSIEEWNKCPRERWVLKGGGLCDLTSVREENETSFIRVWKPLPNRRVLKTLRESSKEKVQKNNIYQR